MCRVNVCWTWGKMQTTFHKIVSFFASNEVVFEKCLEKCWGRNSNLHPFLRLQALCRSWLCWKNKLIIMPWFFKSKFYDNSYFPSLSMASILKLFVHNWFCITVIIGAISWCRFHEGHIWNCVITLRIFFSPIYKFSVVIILITAH